jgi:hypothetical protein
MSKSQELIKVKQDLAALQEEIKDASLKVSEAEKRLLKALEENKPSSPYEKLLDCASADLKVLHRKEESLKRKEEKLTRIEESLKRKEEKLTRIEESLKRKEEEKILTKSEQKIVPEAEGSHNQRERDYLVDKYRKILFRTDCWGCVTVISKRRAITFAHDIHSTLKVGDYMQIYSMESSKSPKEYSVKVSLMNVAADWILLESEEDLCEKEPPIGVTADGRKYIQFGLSARSQNESRFSVSDGVISSSCINKFGHVLGSAGADPGDSGGPCIDEISGELIGMNVGSENIHISGSDTVNEAYDKVSSRFASRAHIIPVSSFFILSS